MSLTQKIGQVIALSTLIFGSFTTSAFSATAPQEKAQETKSETLLAQSTAESKNGEYKLQNCRRTSKEVVCQVLVKNTSDKKRKFSFYIDSSRATDFSGNIYELSKITFNKYVAKKGKNRTMDVFLSPQIPTKLNFYFPIPQNINQLVGIEFGVNTGTYRGNQIVFRNVSIGNNSVGKRKCTCE